MTFFNKKTEVMQIEMTPYGRYLYSIGKFKPHSYEFIDDDIVYKVDGEAQEDAHNRIVNETPKLKINRAFQDEAPQVVSPSVIDVKREMVKKMDHKQNGLYALGRSSYSSDNCPSFQVTMLQGNITGSTTTYEILSSSALPDNTGSIFIPQVEIDVNFVATLSNELEQNGSTRSILSSNVFDDGTFVDLYYKEPIIHLKEFNSFYEKENFEFEVFSVNDSGELEKLKMNKKMMSIVNDLLVDNVQTTDGLFEESMMEYFFDIEVDEQIDPNELCAAVKNLEVNSHFLDEELICPDQRSDRFDIYATRVGPGDLEDCN